MPIVINDQTYYRTAEVCLMVGIIRNTLFTWLEEGIIYDVGYRDWRSWRLLTTAQAETVRARTNDVTAITRGG